MTYGLVMGLTIGGAAITLALFAPRFYLSVIFPMNILYLVRQAWFIVSLGNSKLYDPDDIFRWVAWKLFRWPSVLAWTHTELVKRRRMIWTDAETGRKFIRFWPFEKTVLMDYGEIHDPHGIELVKAWEPAEWCIPWSGWPIIRKVKVYDAMDPD